MSRIFKWEGDSQPGRVMTWTISRFIEFGLDLISFSCCVNLMCQPQSSTWLNSKIVPRSDTILCLPVPTCHLNGTHDCCLFSRTNFQNESIFCCLSIYFVMLLFCFVFKLNILGCICSNWGYNGWEHHLLKREGRLC